MYVGRSIVDADHTVEKTALSHMYAVLDEAVHFDFLFFEAIFAFRFCQQEALDEFSEEKQQNPYASWS